MDGHRDRQTSSTLTKVSPNELHAAWGVIREGLEKVREYSEGWIAEDVYHSLKSGFSTLFLVTGPEYLGFAVAYESQDWRGKSLHLWCVYNGSDTDILANHLDDFKKMARATGAHSITFESPRNWERRLKGYGFLPVYTRYALEV